LFEQCHGDHADLMVYFDDLYWRAGGTVGHPTTYLLENDTGPDDAVHSKEGMYIIRHSKLKAKGRRNAFIQDMAPTILELMGVDIPDDMPGHSIIKV
jgi:predicted AlkP superfamily phosphohydrolase/phosphomutase